jgi:hypothetical protein
MKDDALRLKKSLNRIDISLNRNNTNAVFGHNFRGTFNDVESSNKSQSQYNKTITSENIDKNDQIKLEIVKKKAIFDYKFE